MSPEEIIEAYNVLTKDVTDYTAQEAAKIGNSQRSLGTLAERVASPSGQTSGLANYTYDRTLRPTVDSLAASLTTEGKAQALDKYLDTKLRAAKNAYEDAKNAYTVSSSNKNNDNSNYDEKKYGSKKVGNTTPDGMTSHTFKFDDGKDSYTGIVYFNSDGSIAGVETPYQSYTAEGAINYFNKNKPNLQDWPGGANNSVYDEKKSDKTATTVVPGGEYPSVVDMDGMKVYLVQPDSGDPYYITTNGWKFSVSDVMKWF